MILYHVTAARHLDAIMEEGLVPRIGERSEVMGEGEAGVYLFTSRTALDEAVMNWLGDAYEEDDDLVVLEVELVEGFEISAGFEVETIAREAIPPHRIRLLKRLEPPSGVRLG